MKVIGLSDLPVPKTDAEAIEWAAQNPGVLREALIRANLLTNMQGQFTVPTGARSGPWNLVGSPQQLIFPIPLTFPATIPDVTTYSGTAGGSYDAPTLQALMNSHAALLTSYNVLLQQLRNVNVNPVTPTT
jgi:hypothetical protein